MAKTTILAVLGAFCVFAAADAVDDRVIRVTTEAKAEATRNALVAFVWGRTWSSVTSDQPNTAQTNYTPTPDDALPAQMANLQSIDRLDAGTSVPTQSGETKTVLSTVFVLYPAKGDRHEAVIVHQGHGCQMTEEKYHPLHVEVALRELVAAGYTAVAVRMPLFQSPAHCGVTRIHDTLFDIPLQSGSAVQFFLEPIVKTVNYLRKNKPDLKEIDMTGLSGGGWTTTVYAAIDTRIAKSFPVAGSVPLYLRGEHYNHDLEQYYGPLFHIAGYKDLYVLGALGKGRLQLQILNRYDNCCFGEKQHTVGGAPFIEAVRAYEHDVQTALKGMHSGQFALHIDESAQYHQISEESIKTVILPVLGGAAPPQN